jgi:hypothetical protein
VIPYVLTLLLVQPNVIDNEATWEARLGPVAIETTMVTHDTVRRYQDCGEVASRLYLDVAGLLACLPT